MKKIVFLDRNSLADSALIPKLTQDLATQYEWIEYAQTSPNQLVERCSSADILVLSKVPIDNALLQSCPKLKHIAVAATGYNVVEIDACRKHGVSVSNIPNYAANTVAEHVIMVVLNLRRELQQYRQKVIDGAWQKSTGFCLFDKPVNDLQGATMGIVGLGDIGQRTAQLAHALGMSVVFSARHTINNALTDKKIAKQVEFNELIKCADIISLHCSLNASTTNLIDSQEFEQMQKHAILINTARGGIVNELALVNAIQNKVIGGAAFDVLGEEPPKDNASLLSIASLSNVIITPHISWTSQQAMQSLLKTLINNIEGFILGQAQNIVS